MLTLVTVVMLSAADGGTVDTKATMREAFSALVRLQEVAAQPDALHDPKRAAGISADLGRLKGLTHGFPADARAQEPATAALSSLFGRYAAETQRRFDARQLDAVGPRVRTLMSLCVTCHARERASGEFADAFARIDSLGLTGLERATVLVSTRQFDAALAEYRAMLTGPVTDFTAYSRALDDAMTLLVRVKDDAPATAALLEQVEARKDLPKFFAANVAAWKRDVASWRAEQFDAARASPEVLFTRAKALVAQADGTGLFADERKDVLWLRASAYLNLALAKNPRLSTRGEALLLLGQCAGGLRSPSWWDVDELFYEACVRENPRTALAKRCFERLSERVTLGFTGSGGTFIPDDEVTRLQQLKALTR